MDSLQTVHIEDASRQCEALGFDDGKKADPRRVADEDAAAHATGQIAAIASLRANINETFLAAQIREQGEKEMNDDRWSEGGGVGPAGS